MSIYGSRARAVMQDWLSIAPDLEQVAEIVYGRGGAICPPRDLCFRALEELPPYAVRVVILGQDPYYTPGKANGLAFGYHPEYEGPVDSSLYNILQEMGVDLDSFDPGSWHNWRNLLTLDHLPKQGVLLLNTRLTCIQHEPMSHSAVGWEKPISQVIQWLANRKQPVVWLLMGREADSTANRAGLDILGSHIIYTSHPSGLSARKGMTPFLGSKCFRRVNEILVAQGQKPIIWKGN